MESTAAPIRSEDAAGHGSVITIISPLLEKQRGRLIAGENEVCQEVSFILWLSYVLELNLLVLGKQDRKFIQMLENTAV